MEKYGSLDTQLRHMRRVLGLTPITRIQDLERDFAAVEEAARATEGAYQEVVDRIRRNDRDMENSLFVPNEESFSSIELSDESHRAAAAVLQSSIEPRGASGIDPSNIILPRLRSQK